MIILINLFLFSKNCQKGLVIFSTRKLRTYALFKKEKGFEPYLTEIKNTSVRKLVTKFRLSNHRLMIEVGRHQGLSIEDRLCPMCTASVENEAHFLLSYPIYHYQRELLLTPITSKHTIFSNWPETTKTGVINV